MRIVLINLWKHKITIFGATTVIGMTSFNAWASRSTSNNKITPNIKYWKENSRKEMKIDTIPNRTKQIDTLQRHCRPSTKHYKYKYDTYRLLNNNNNNNNRYNRTEGEYDVLVIGGGATGCGIALDGVTRGLNVALIEKNDFSSGTSSRSTKLIHGGVRYLEKAIMKLDTEQWGLVKEAIAERQHLLNICPHLSNSIPIIIPIYDTIYLRGLYKLCKYWIGTKLYNAIAGKDGSISDSYYLSASSARHVFPQLKQTNLIGSIVYFDGQHNDSRMNLSIALTAASYGATIVNHVEVVDFIKDESDEERIVGVRLRDNLTGIEWNTFAKVVINATGPFVDKLRKLDYEYCDNIVIPSQGTHLALPAQFCSDTFGMLIPQTKDGRVAFLLPWEGATIAGTTDEVCKLSDLPRPKEKEAEQILGYINEFLDKPADMSDIDAAWTGIRPLASIPNNDYQVITHGTVNLIKPTQDMYDKQRQRAWNKYRDNFRSKDKSKSDENSVNTSKISRNHLIEKSLSGLITITGGKWTTYRKMAEDVLDLVCNDFPEVGRKATECVTKYVKLLGSTQYTHSVPAILERHLIPKDISSYLSKNYGDKSFILGNLYLSKWNKILAGGYPYTEAEVIYCSQYEMCYTATDFLCRRTRLAQLNKAAAEYALKNVINIMGEVHKWDSRTRVSQYHETMQFLRTMHVKDRHKWGRSRHTLKYSRGVVECVLNGPSMTDAAIQFVIDRFLDYHNKNMLRKEELELQEQQLNNNGINDINDDDINDEYYEDAIISEEELNELLVKGDHEKIRKKYKKSTEIFEGCISRQQAYKLAKEFAHVFGDDRVIDALMFTGLKELGLYEILVSCAACAADPHLFDPPGPWISV